MDLTSLPRDVTLDFTKSLVDRENEMVGESCIHFNLAITASRVEDEDDMAKEQGKKPSHSNDYVRPLTHCPRSL